MNVLKTCVVVILFANSALAESTKCFEKINQQERRDMVAAFMNKKYKDFDVKFNQLCLKYKSELLCDIKTVKSSEAAEKMSAVSRQSNCAEVMRVEEGKKVKIYAFDDKSASKK
ncbi:hypothetical protein DOM22_04900 [Bdellovibrio sp. ZAP7]|uniref:hypothetical protein n=1 Tax=Bdellovibrio sp. ZAP7 TaxID=2231053 RepID=UPI00115A23C5|nr:hypothetical protein [Bdellovibrio sp. ZAP7]QDK44542.1 hypothetical protein DOM22_04900 [Bdellovibrio sp. ZAP7]